MLYKGTKNCLAQRTKACLSTRVRTETVSSSPWRATHTHILSSLTNELTNVSIGKHAMGEFIDRNHIAELVIVQNMNKLFDVITNVENYTLAWHNDHSHSIVGLRARKIIDTSWYNTTRNLGSIYVEDQLIKVDFRGKQLQITTVEDFSLYS